MLKVAEEGSQTGRVPVTSVRWVLTPGGVAGVCRVPQEVEGRAHEGMLGSQTASRPPDNMEQS